MTGTDLQGRRILITGGSAGLGRAMAEAALARGAEVAVIARGGARLAEIARLGARTFAGDATDAAFMGASVRKARPDVLILNAGAPLAMGPIDELDFVAFSSNWNADVKAGLAGIQAAFHVPMTAGSRILLMSSGAAMVLSAAYIPNQSLYLSGGYVGAKYMLWFMAHNANAVAEKRGLGLHFQVLVPTQLMAGTELGRKVATVYADLKGITSETYLENRYGPPLTPAHLAKQVADILSEPRYGSGVAYGLTTGEEPVGLDT
jgi:NAD(P)-dependent dehydrogenase (short-subunit alcohol dehydrogenase family)